MSDAFEDLLKRWLRERAGTDRSALEALSGHVAVLPPRGQRPSRLLSLAASIVVLLGGLVLVAPRLGFVVGDASPSLPAGSHYAGLPGGPEAFADDPRLGRCFGSAADMQFAFEMTHARDYRLYLPNMGMSPELDVDAAALAVVYREGWVGPALVGGPGARPSPIPGLRFVCVVTTDGDPNLYSDVDITGITVDVVPSSPAPTDVATAEPTGAPPSTTPEPSPAWMAGAEAALGCDGPPSEFGYSWSQYGPDTAEWATPEAAMADLATDIENLRQPFPTAGFVEIGRTDEAAAFAYHRRGSARAVVTLGAVGASSSRAWYVAEVASCDASEFGPEAQVPVRIAVWSDASGEPVPTTVVKEIEDCYNGTKLTFDGRLYVWDPELGTNGIYDLGQLESTIAVLADLPPGAIDTGYRDGERRLYIAADGHAAFIAGPEGFQRWPHVIGDVYQRIDCN